MVRMLLDPVVNVLAIVATGDSVFRVEIVLVHFMQIHFVISFMHMSWQTCLHILIAFAV